MIRRGKGFTLIELLVAISLAAVVVLLATALMRISLSADTRYHVRQSERQALRDAYRLVEHFWLRRLSSGMHLSHESLIFQSMSGENGTRSRVGFACQSDGAGAFSFAMHRGPNAETQDGGEGVAGSTPYWEVLLSGLRQCEFAYLLPPPAGTDGAAKWLEEWTQQMAPEVMRLDLATNRGVLPPMIISAESM